jgi:hypothetical protein
MVRLGDSSLVQQHSSSGGLRRMANKAGPFFPSRCSSGSNGSSTPAIQVVGLAQGCHHSTTMGSSSSSS